MMARKSTILMSLAAVAYGANNPHPALGPYTPVSNVVEHSQMVYDVADLVAAVKKEEWTTAKVIYTEGRYSCKSTSKRRILQGFVSSSTATAKLADKAFFTGFTSGSGPASPKWSDLGSGRLNLEIDFWDDLMMAALEGTGVFSGTAEDVIWMRKYAVNKGVLGVLTMYAAYEMESAISKAHAGETADSKAPHAWDEGWAFLYGSKPGGADSAWEFSKKRDSDFYVDNDAKVQPGAVQVSTLIDNYFREGLVASRVGGSVADMVTASKNIYRLLALSAIRAALKYSYTTQNGGYSAKYHMEGYAYFLSAAGWIEQASPGTATSVLNLLDYKKSSSQLSSNLYCAVKAALIPAYKPLGLSCQMVGTYKKFGTSDSYPPEPTDTECAAAGINMPACPTGVADLPTGTTSETALNTDTTAGSNVDCTMPLPGTGTTPAPAPEPDVDAAWKMTVGMMPVLVAGLFV